MSQAGRPSRRVRRRTASPMPSLRSRRATTASTIITLPDGSTINLIGLTQIDGTLFKGPGHWRAEGCGQMR